MNIEEAIEIINEILSDEFLLTAFNQDSSFESRQIKAKAIETLLTAYEKEKEKNNKIDEFCRKELAFERMLQRENRQPDEFNQGRFYVSENVRKIIKEE